MKVLVAEDSLLWRRLLQSSLAGLNFDVAVACDGADAWRQFQQERFSLVLTDWIMPEMDGLELIRHIRATPLPSYVYIILLTARGEKGDLVEGMQAGADDFMTKPIDHGELRARIRQGERMIGLQRILADQNRQLRQTQAALVESEKLAGLGQLAAGMAHEINNPLAFVSNNLAVLKRDVTSVFELLEKYREAGTAIQREAPDLFGRIARAEEECDLAWLRENLPQLFAKSHDGLGRVRAIVNNLRDFASVDQADFTDLDINGALRSTTEVLRTLLDEKKLTVTTALADSPVVSCQPRRIQQLLHSLLLNAIQASQPGGVIALRTAKLADGVEIEIEDHGCGIDSADLPRIFDPFFTTKAVGQGAGLGLAISYGVACDHGGSISVESQLRRGSVFRVRLPRRPPRVPAG